MMTATRFSLTSIVIVFGVAVTFTPVGVISAANDLHADYQQTVQEIDRSGPFKATWESLESGYEMPEWFRDAKFGIWAHWGAQCEPEQGDWYAQRMYIQGHNQYKFHVEHYGHPSKFGFKDVIHQWKAERFNPEQLIALYKKAGAKYFVAMANHHDNLDNWNSKYQPWNSVAVGPHKDLVGMWAKAARQAGLRFGVTVHAGRAWSWYETAQGADKTGPLAGAPYDGKLRAAEGKGQWWDGLDPQDLYAQNHPLHAPPSRAYCEKFFMRVIQLLDDYNPDLLYFDDGVLPLRGVSEEYGLRIASHFYNVNTARRGHNEAVMTTKGLDKQQRKALVWDIERGKAKSIEPFTWQTDTCIGGWHYNQQLYDEHKYKTAAIVVPMLVDIVSKNGNLLLNIPVKSDGTIDSDEQTFLREMAAWIDVNGAAIYATRPWKIYGEGPSVANAKPTGRFGGMRDTGSGPLAATDIRFTRSKDGNTLYAIAFGWPEKALTLTSVNVKSVGSNAQVRLLGVDQPLRFTVNGDGQLLIAVPPLAEAKRPCKYAYSFAITGMDIDVNPQTLAALADGGDTVRLVAAQAVLWGDRIHVEDKIGRPNIGFWDNPSETVHWLAKIQTAGKYEIHGELATAQAGAQVRVDVAGQKVTARVPDTGGFAQPKTLKLGALTFDKPGVYHLTVSAEPEAWRAINVWQLVLIPQHK